MSDEEKYLDTADRLRLLVRLAILHVHCLFNCPVEGKFPDRAFFEFLRDMYLKEFPLETHDACRLKGMLSRVSERSKARMATSTPPTHRPDEQEFEDLWGQLRNVFDLLVYTKKMQVVEKDLFRAAKVCSSAIEPKSLLRPDQELSALLNTMKTHLLATAKERSRDHLLWLRNFKRDVSIQMESRRSEAISYTTLSDDGDPNYDDEKDGDLSDDDCTAYDDFEDRDATFSPGSRATATSSSSSVPDIIFSSSPFPSSATDQASDNYDGYCEDSVMTSRSPTPTPAKRPKSVQGLPRLRPGDSDRQISNARHVPFISNTASIGPGDHCPSQESTNGNGASVEASGSKRHAVAYIDLTTDDDDPGYPGHPLSEALRGSVSVGDQGTPRSPTKRISPAKNSTFKAAFSDGWKALTAPRDGYCGLHAIVLSFKAQYPHYPPPNVEELRGVLESPAMEGIMETLEASRFTGDERPELDFACDNTDWFLQDHLAAIFSLWGQQVGLKIALGILTNNTPHLHDSDDTDEETLVVWIEHNGIDHYNGIASESPYQEEEGESPDTPYEMVEREEASPYNKESTLPSRGSSPVTLLAESTTVNSVPEDDSNMSNDSGTMRESSHSKSSQLGSPEPFQQYESLEGCEKMESSDLMMSGALQPAPRGGVATPPTQRQLTTPQPSQLRKHVPLKRKKSFAAEHRSGVPGTLSFFTLPHRLKDPENTPHPPQKRQRHGLANISSPLPYYHMSTRCPIHSRKGSRLSRRCYSEQPRPAR